MSPVFGPSLLHPYPPPSCPNSASFKYTIQRVLACLSILQKVSSLDSENTYQSLHSVTQILSNLDNSISHLSLIFSAFIYYSGYDRSKIQWFAIEGNTADGKVPHQQEARSISATPSGEMVFLVTTLTSLVAQTIKDFPTMWETWVQSLGWEDLLEKEMATHYSILAWKIPRMEQPGRHGVTKSWTRLSNFTFT